MKMINQLFRLQYRLAYLLLVLIPVFPLYAAEVTFPDNAFTSGETLTAEKLNAMFNELKATINADQSQSPSGVIAVAGVAFHSLPSQANCLSSATVTGYFYFSSGSGCGAIAPIQLPHNATLLSMDCSVFDNHGFTNANILLRLNRVDLTNSADLAIFETYASSNSADVQTISDAIPSVELVDNTRYAYWLSAKFGADPGGGDVGLYGCTIYYE